MGKSTISILTPSPLSLVKHLPENGIVAVPFAVVLFDDLWVFLSPLLEVFKMLGAAILVSLPVVFTEALAVLSTVFAALLVAGFAITPMVLSIGLSDFLWVFLSVSFGQGLCAFTALAPVRVGVLPMVVSRQVFNLLADAALLLLLRTRKQLELISHSVFEHKKRQTPFTPRYGAPALTLTGRVCQMAV